MGLKHAEWEEIAQATSSSSPVNWNGVQIYYWEALQTVIPKRLWEKRPNPDFPYECRVHAVYSNGYELATFNQDYNYEEAWFMTPPEVWSEFGNGTRMRLYVEEQP